MFPFLPIALAAKIDPNFAANKPSATKATAVKKPKKDAKKSAKKAKKKKT